MKQIICYKLDVVSFSKIDKIVASITRIGLKCEVVKISPLYKSINIEVPSTFTFQESLNLGSLIGQIEMM
jgi:hypothetical protein